MKFAGAFCVLLTMVFFSTAALAGSSISNGDFEFYDYNETLDFNTPNNWEIENYAAVVSHFIPQPTQGSVANWKIDPYIGLYPAQGDSFLLLSTGEIRPDPNHALAYQQVDVNEGERISGFYFFGASDYLPYNDFGTIKLIPDGNSALEEITLAYSDINQVGRHSCTNGWQRFDYVFDSNESGTYNLVLLVQDVGDFIYESYFAIDGLAICNPAGPGDLYIDCCIDFTDFALFSNDWLSDCNDPYADPNSNCYLGTDLNDDGPVDINDLWLFSENWLAGDAP